MEWGRPGTKIFYFAKRKQCEREKWKKEKTSYREKVSVGDENGKKLYSNLLQMTWEFYPLIWLRNN